MYISKGDKTSAGWKTEKINNEVAGYKFQSNLMFQTMCNNSLHFIS